MKNLTKLTSIAIAIATLTTTASAGPNAVRAGVERPYDPYVNEAGEPINDPDDPLFAANCVAFGLGLNEPIFAPDGHRVTLSEWSQVKGHATARCTPHGTLITLHVSGLLPGGAYTAWLATFNAPGYDWFWTNLRAVGALGAPDGSENVLQVSPSGEANLMVIQHGGALSMLGEVSDCMLDEFQFQIAIAYHLDHQTYGGLPAENECLISIPIGFTFTP